MDHRKGQVLGILVVVALMLLVGAAPASADSNLILNGNFAAGNTGFTSSYTYGNVTGGDTYYIATSPASAPGAYPDWGTFTGPTGSGNMLIANGGAGAVWSETVAVTANTTYTFTYWGAEVDASSGSVPDLELAINGTNLGAEDFPSKSPSNGGSWTEYSFTWNSGSNTTAVLSLTDLNTQFDYNDFAITNLSFSAPPTTPTPEPGTLLLLVPSLLGLGLVRRRFDGA
jgi:hypothetical protein